MINKKFSKKNSVMIVLALMAVFVLSVIVSVNALTDLTRPTIVSMSPINNEQSMTRDTQVKVTFSEPMDPATINKNTFIVTQRTTPEMGVYRSDPIEGKVIYYNDNTATFQPSIVLGPDQEFGNVFTVTITDGAKDLAGNSLIQDYVWSFTTGGNVFNTGNTTSQSNQSSALIAAPVVVQPVSPPEVITTPALTPASTTSGFPLIYYLGGLLLLLVIALVTISMTRSAAPKSKKDIQNARSHPFGDVHPVMEIEGIGEKYNKGLHAIGIKNTKQLFEANAAKVARAIGAPVSTVKSWQNMSELASVKDIGPQYAELLERSGVHSIDQLKDSNPTTLLNLVHHKEDSLKVNIQGNTIGQATVENWIDEARNHELGNEELTA